MDNISLDESMHTAYTRIDHAQISLRTATNTHLIPIKRASQLVFRAEIENIKRALFVFIGSLLVLVISIDLDELITFIQMGRFENNVIPTRSLNSASQKLYLSFLIVCLIHCIRIFSTTGITLKSQPCVRGHLLILSLPDCLSSRQLVLPQAGDMSVLKFFSAALTE